MKSLIVSSLLHISYRSLAKLFSKLAPPPSN